MPSARESSQWSFLIDENMPARLTGHLRAAGYEAEHAYARARGATLITQDHDLQRDALLFPPHSGVVLVKLPQD